MTSAVEVSEEQISTKYLQQLDHAITVGISATKDLKFYGPFDYPDTFIALMEAVHEWRIVYKTYIYPIKESMILLGARQLLPPDFKNATDIDYIKEELTFWVEDLLEIGFETILSNPTIKFQGINITINPSLIERLFNDILPNVYPENFFKFPDNIDKRRVAALKIGTKTFIDIFLAFINEVRRDETLITLEDRRNALKSLSFKSGEMFKMMSIGLNTVLDIENDYIIHSDMIFRPNILAQKPHNKNYIDNAPGGVKHKLIHRIDKNENIQRCPAAAALLIIVSKIADALPDEFLMGKPGA